MDSCDSHGQSNNGGNPYAAGTLATQLFCLGAIGR